MGVSSVDFEHYFARQIALWGEEKQAALRAKKIAIIGCGGLGSSLALSLGTSGIGGIDLVDFDTVSVHNIHRQVAFTLADEGRPKAEVVAEMIRAKSPFVTVTPHPIDFAVFSEQDGVYDLILDATDNLPAREAIDRWAKAKGIPWVYGSVEAFNGQVCFFDRGLFGVFAVTDRTPAGIAAPIVMHIASLQANFALRYLVGLPVVRDKLYYLFFDDVGELQTQKFGMPTAG